MNHEIKDDEAPFKMKDGVVTAEQKSPVASSLISNDRFHNIKKNMFKQLVVLLKKILRSE